MNDEQYTLREPHFSCNAVFKPEKDLLRVENTYLWNNY